MAQLHNTHTNVVHSYEIQSLCQPLQKFAVNFFCVARFYQNNTVRLLSNNNQLYQHFFDREYLLTTPIPKNHLKQQFHFLVTGDGAYQRAMHDTYQIIDATHMIDLITIFDDYYEMLCFAGHQGYNDLIGNIDKLYQFSYDFKSRTADFFNSDDCLVQLPKSMQAHILDDFYATTKTEADIGYKTSHFYLDDSCTLSQREMACAVLLACGLSLKAIANQLNICDRTVETYLNKAKLKLHVTRRYDLVIKIRQTPGFHALCDQLLSTGSF